jgi:hypothetical protein
VKIQPQWVVTPGKQKNKELLLGAKGILSASDRGQLKKKEFSLRAS